MSKEIRHTLGSLAVCIAPWAYMFDLCDLRIFGFACAAGLTLLISTVQPGPRPRP